MPIEIFTGLPGHGKTTFMVKRLLEEANKPPEKMRPLWAAGIDGLKPGIASNLKDPREWNAVKPGEVCTCHDTESSAACDAHVIPNGSLIFVDEAWKWFGHLQDASRQPMPAYVLHLAEHRHRGIDFVWTTQMPSQLYPFARALVADHHHHVRRFGSRFVDVFTWSELNDDVKSAAKREAAQRKTVVLEASAWAVYKSAEVHTIKRRIPFKVMALPAIVIAALVVGWFAYQHLKPDAITARISGTEPPSGEAAAATPHDAPAPHPVYKTAAEYAAAFTPLIADRPWTAPAYAGFKVASKPVAICVKGGRGLDANGAYQSETCKCITEQGTKYDIGYAECVANVEAGGVYNPTKEPPQERETRAADFNAPGAGPRPAAMAGTAAPSLGGGGSQAFGSMTTYGELGVGTAP
jgi:hypothetical protein